MDRKYLGFFLQRNCTVVNRPDREAKPPRGQPALNLQSQLKTGCRSDAASHYATLFTEILLRLSTIVPPCRNRAVIGDHEMDDHDPIEELADLSCLDQGRADHFAVINQVRKAFKDVSEAEIERETDRILSSRNSSQP